MRLCRLLFDRYRLPLSRAQVFAILRNDRRRFTITILAARSSQMPFAELVDQVTAHERTSTEADAIEDRRMAVYVALYQTHLPRLETLGLVEHDPEAGTVAITDDGRAVSRYLRGRSTRPSPWAILFLVLSSAYVVVLVGVWQTTRTVPTSVAVLVLTGYSAAALAYVLLSRWCRCSRWRCSSPVRNCL